MLPLDIPPDLFIAVLGQPNPLLRMAVARAARWTAWPAAAAPAGIPEARNAIVARWLAAADLPWLLMLDADAVLVAESAPLLASQAEVTGARILARAGHLAHPHTLSAAALKIGRGAAERIGRPWFAWPRGKQLPGSCECVYFSGRCAAAGIRPIIAGAVGHRVPVTLLPREDTGETPVPPGHQEGEPVNTAERLAALRARRRGDGAGSERMTAEAQRLQSGGVASLAGELARRADQAQAGTEAGGPEQMIPSPRETPQDAPGRAISLPAGSQAACLRCPDQRACPNVTRCCGAPPRVEIVAPCPRGRW